MTRSLQLCSSLIAASLLVACGGGGNSAVPAGLSPGKTGAHASAALSFFIPAGSTAHVRMKRPSYLSSATQSIVVNVFNADGTPTDPPTSPSITNVGAGSSACTAASGGQQCTVTIVVPEGALLFAIAAYAQPNGAGALLSSSTTSSTIGTGPNNVSATLSAQTQYIGTNLSGGGMQSVTIDHQAGTFQVMNGTTVADSGTFTNLPNGDIKATITSAADSTPIGSVAYIREMANGALMFVATDTPTPNVDGSSTHADFGVMTEVQSCPSASTSFPVNVIGMAGPNFASVVSTHEAYDVGSANVASGTLTFSGTSYTLSGTSLGAASVLPQACSNGVFTDATGGSVVYDPSGFLVVASGPNQGSSPSITGNFGFRAPSQPYSLSTLASQNYEAYSGQDIPDGQGGTTRMEIPYAVTPGGGNMLKACSYVNFEANSASTSSCTTITLNAQPSPGLITGTAANASGTAQFVAAVGEVNGKFVLVVLAADQTSGQAVNLALMQQ